MELKQGQTIRSEKGSARITYDPEFYRSNAFAVFINGTAVNAFPTLQQAIDRCARSGCTFKTPYEWK